MAAQSTGQSDLAKRYASAFFDLALEQDQLDQLAGELNDLGALMNDSPDLARLVRSPIVSRREQGAAMAAIIARADMSNFVGNLTGLMAQNRRLFALKDTIAAVQTPVAKPAGALPSSLGST